MSTAIAEHARSRVHGQRSGESDVPVAIHLMENHDRAYHVWRDAGLRERVLVHIDAHHDMWWTEDAGSLSIANFICPALRQNIVRELYWVVPDGTWASSAGRAALRRHLRKIHERYPGEPAPVQWQGRSIRTSVLGRPFTICSLGSLPDLREQVLLDIDVDYLTIPRVSYDERDAHNPLPWRWPSELVAMLRAKRISSDIVTIAYSVEGGYTPLAWKYLGTELAARLRHSPDGCALEPYARMQEGLVAQQRRDHAQAEAAFRDVGDRLGAAPHFCLAHLLAEHGQPAEGRRCYERAVAIDPSYRGAYASPGIVLHFARRFAEAEQAFRRTLLLDPSDPYAQLGLGWVAVRRRNWVEAEQRSRASLAIQPDLIDAWRLHGTALAKLGRLDEAIEAYERSLKLALGGQRPFDGVIATEPEGARLFDSSHGRTHATLARLHERKGDRKRATAGYRIAVAGGYDRFPVRFRLARICAAQHRWSEACTHACAGLRSALGAGWGVAAGGWRRAREFGTGTRFMHPVTTAW